MPGDVLPVGQGAGDRRVAIDRLDAPLAGEPFDHPPADETGGSGQHQPRR
jgi:hypothetical protein